jgi:hypothetical protein
MSAKRLMQLGLCAVLATAVTAVTAALDLQRSGVQQTQAGLAWARQVASQAEGMSLRARENGERDPIDWAVNYLSQGVEPRLVRISPAHVLDSSAQNTESYQLSRERGIFDYTRIFSPEDGTGVHIQLTMGYLGFFGARSALANDFLVALFFGLCFAIAFLRTGRYFGFDDARYLRLLVSQWVSGAKAQLTRHGAHIREMVRQSQRLAAGAGRSRGLVEGLRSRIHEGLTELHGSREFYREGENIAARAEQLALNIAIEANRLGGDARRIADMASELHRRIQALHGVNRKGQALVQSLERRIEPWTTDADLAYHAFDEVRDATQLLGQHIRSTTESLLGQARLIQGLNQELGMQESQPEPRREALAAQPEPTPASVPVPMPVAAPEAPQASSAGQPRLPDPLPPLLDESEPKPLFRRIRARKSA